MQEIVERWLHALDELKKQFNRSLACFKHNNSSSQPVENGPALLNGSKMKHECDVRL